MGWFLMDSRKLAATAETLFYRRELTLKAKLESSLSYFSFKR
jgi:hypothetical protein